MCMCVCMCVCVYMCVYHVHDMSASHVIFTHPKRTTKIREQFVRLCARCTVDRLICAAAAAACVGCGNPCHLHLFYSIPILIHRTSTSTLYCTVLSTSERVFVLPSCTRLDEPNTHIPTSQHSPHPLRSMRFSIVAAALLAVVALTSGVSAGTRSGMRVD